MGCDIHLFVERRESATEPWKPILVPTKCWATWMHSDPKKAEMCTCRGTNIRHGYDSRNYDVFAVLADVRNGDGIAPIAAPRGFPSDLSKELCAARGEDGDYNRNRALYGSGWFGDHSFSHVTLAELLAYDWDTRITIAGVVNPAQYEVFHRTGKPLSYCKSVGGHSVEFVGPRVMRAIAVGATFAKAGDEYEGGKIIDVNDVARAALEQAGLYWNWSVRGKHAKGITTILGEERSLYCHIEWADTVKERCGDFCTSFIPALQQAATTGAENLRLVFGFDS